MKLVIFDDSRQDRENVRGLLEQYGKEKQMELEIAECDAEGKLCQDTAFPLQFQFVEGSVQLMPEEILYIETNRHKNFFYTASGTYSIYKKLGDIEMELKGMGFVRAHQSFLVNMRYVEKISSYVLRLTNGQEISVPKSLYQEVKRQYLTYKETTETEVEG